MMEMILACAAIMPMSDNLYSTPSIASPQAASRAVGLAHGKVLSLAVRPGMTEAQVHAILGLPSPLSLGWTSSDYFQYGIRVHWSSPSMSVNGKSYVTRTVKSVTHSWKWAKEIGP